MSPSDYLDPKQFPLSTQKGLNLNQQMMIDAFNLDELRQAIEYGESLDDDQKAVLEELETKVKSWKSIVREYGTCFAVPMVHAAPELPLIVCTPLPAISPPPAFGP